jgi:hypothetical protein
MFDGVRGKWARCVDVHPLNSGAILDGSIIVWLMLWQVGSQVLEFKESFGNLVGYVVVDGTGRIIPVNVNTTKEGAVPDYGDGVVFF